MCLEALVKMTWYFLFLHPWSPALWLAATGYAIYCVYWVVQELRAHRRDQLTERPNRIDLILLERRRREWYKAQRDYHRRYGFGRRGLDVPRI